MTERALRNEYRTTQVCVDDLQDGRFRGRLYNPFWKGCIRFNGVTEFLARMEEQLDLMQFPQSFTARRTFAEVTEKTSARREPLEMRRGGRGHLLSAGALPAEQQLAGRHPMGGGRTEAILPQCVGAADDDVRPRPEIRKLSHQTEGAFSRLTAPAPSKRQ